MNYKLGGTKTKVKLRDIKVGQPFEDNKEIYIKGQGHHSNKDYYWIFNVLTGQVMQGKDISEVIALYIVEPPKFDYVSTFIEKKET